MSEERLTAEEKYGCLCYAQPDGTQCYQPPVYRVCLNGKWFFCCLEHAQSRWDEWDTVLPLECTTLRARIAELEKEREELYKLVRAIRRYESVGVLFKHTLHIKLPEEMDKEAADAVREAEE